MRISISQCLAEVPSRAVGYAVTPGECKSLGIRHPRDAGTQPRPNHPALLAAFFSTGLEEVEWTKALPKSYFQMCLVMLLWNNRKMM